MRVLRATAGVALLSILACGDEQIPESPVEPVVPASADHHLHIRSQAAAEHFDRLPGEPGEPIAPDAEPTAPLTADDALSALDAAGIEGGVILSNAYLYSMPEATANREEELVRAENEYVASEVARHPDRLVGLCSVNPLRPYALEEVTRCGADDRIAGLKIHLTNSDVDLRDEDHLDQLGSVFAAADDAGLAVVIHMRSRAPDYGAEDVEAFIERVYSRTSRISVQIAHMGGWGGYDDGTEAALDVFAAAIEDGRADGSRLTFGLGAVVFQPAAAGSDTALVAHVRRNNERLAERIRRVGIERVVYATDWPSWPPVADPVTGIDRNLALIRAELPLTDNELDQLFGNVGAVFSGRPQ